MVPGEGEEEQACFLWGLLGEGVEERVQVGPREGEGERPLRVVRERTNSSRHGSLLPQNRYHYQSKGPSHVSQVPFSFPSLVSWARPRNKATMWQGEPHARFSVSNH